MRKRFLVGCLLPLLLVTAAACSTSDDGRGVASVGGSAAPSATPSLSELEQAIRYTRCMREHGVPMSDPQVVNGDVRMGGGFDKDALGPDAGARAQEACKQYEPVMPAGLAAVKAELAREESRCMREHGVENFPDPDAEAHVDVSEQVRKDPQYDQAKAFCREYIRSYRPSAEATPR